MHKLFYILIMSLALTACNDTEESFVGYVVGREYVAEHMCHDDESTYQTISEAGFVHVPHTTPHVHHHQLVEAEWTLWVANKEEVRRFNVTKETYETSPMLDKVIF